eukprot:TRINITY_DN13297_c0_g1_i8.p1 TRINITY_DN13297_c0_g1~~TRINITY_DN13297_c0_g1_i8.p1  ORF type:complete len:1353 (+),score=511.28 TRINITY_DN13297_c0_g1_i8:1-4059(+)
MAGLLSREHFDELLPRLVQSYLAMYKKERPADHFPISQGLCNLIEVAVRDGRYNLEPQLPLILNTIHPLVAVPIDYKAPNTVKNCNEMLRCFEVLTRQQVFLDPVLTYVVNRFQSKEPPLRLASLIIVRHLINSCGAVLEEKKAFLMSSVQVLMDEQNLRVKKALIQLIVSMADANYLTLEGGQNLVLFVIRQSAISNPEIARFDAAQRERKSAEVDDVTPGQLRHAADHILNVLVTRVFSTHDVLWPFLLELMKPPELGSALGVICKSLVHLIEHKRANNDPSLQIVFEHYVNLPKPQLLLARLMTIANTPFHNRIPGAWTLKCMNSLGPILHPLIGQYWNEHVPALIEFLEGHNEESLTLQKWEDTILKLFKETVQLMDNEGWLVELAEALCFSFEKYSVANSSTKRVLSRYLGSVLAFVKNREFVKSKIDFMLAAVDNKDEVERQGCAQGLGLCSRTHLDIVLEKLTAVLKRVEGSKKSGFLGLGGPKEAPDADFIRSTVVLCLGYVTAYAPPDLITSRVDMHVFNNILPLIPKANVHYLKESIIKSVDLIGKSLFANRLPRPFLVRCRDELALGLLGFMRTGSFEIKVLGLNALSTLANLEPPFPPQVRQAILDESLPYLELDESKGNIVPAVDAVDLIISNLHNLLSSIIQVEPVLPVLTELLQRLEFWIISTKSRERDRACTAYLVLLKKFISKITVEKCPQNETTMPLLGRFLAILLPRCSDSRPTIRTTAIENVQALLYIDQVLRNPDDSRPSQDILLFTNIRTRMESEPAQERPAVVRDLASLISTLVSPDELPTLLHTLVLALNDSDIEAAHGSSYLINGIFQARAQELEPTVTQLMDGLLASLSKMLVPALVEHTLEAVRKLAMVHFLPLVNHLLEQRLPISPEIVKVFVTIAKTEQLVIQLINTLLSVINDSPFSEEKAVPPVMAATSALTEVIKVPEVAPLLEEFYAPIFCTLLFRIGSAFGVDRGESADDALEALQTFLTSASETGIIEHIVAKGGWDVFKSERYENGITTLVEKLCQVHGDRKRPFFEYIMPFLSRNYVGHRSVATTIISEFVNHSQTDLPLLRKSISTLLPRVADKHQRVRQQALKGVGNLINVWCEEVGQQSSSIMSSLMSAMEDQVESVAAEAVRSMIKIVEVVDDNTMAAMLVNICFRMRPAFDRNDPSIRSSACTLFGRLTRFGNGQAADNFLDQVMTNVPIFLVHLNDEDENVRKACLEGFLRVVRMLNVAGMTEATENFSGEPYDYDLYIESISPFLVSNYQNFLAGFLQALVAYYRSNWHVIRANSAIVTGNLVRVMAPEVRRRVDVSDTCRALLALLNEPNPIVRAKSAKALSFLHNV